MVIVQRVHESTCQPTTFCLPHIQTRKKGKENTHSRIQNESIKVENFPCEEWRIQEILLTPVKLESKNQAKKEVEEREGLRWEVPIEH